MVLNYNKDKYLDIDRVVGIRWEERENNPDSGMGQILLEGEKFMVIRRDEFDAIKDAFIWKHADHTYDKDRKLIKRGK